MDTKSVLIDILNIIGFEANKEAFATEFIEASIKQAKHENAIEQIFADNFYQYIAYISKDLTEDKRIELAQYLASINPALPS